MNACLTITHPVRYRDTGHCCASLQNLCDVLLLCLYLNLYKYQRCQVPVVHPPVHALVSYLAS